MSRISSTAHKTSVYSTHPGFAREAASTANLQKSTGKSLEEWIALVKKEGPEQESKRAAWLKAEHKLGTNIAGWIAERAEGKRGTEDYDPDALVAAMYSGKKAALLPLYEKLLNTVFVLGNDVKACPCKTIVPFYRKHVFAELKPSTNTRIDLGLALKGTEAKPPLIDTGGLAKGDRITHRIPISGEEDVSPEVIQWLQRAYDLDV